jgi:hypothetical protein
MDNIYVDGRVWERWVLYIPEKKVYSNTRNLECSYARCAVASMTMHTAYWVVGILEKMTFVYELNPSSLARLTINMSSTDPSMEARRVACWNAVGCSRYLKPSVSIARTVAS